MGSPLNSSRARLNWAGYEVPGSIEEQISGGVDRRLLTLEQRQQTGLGGTDLPDIEAAAADVFVSNYVQEPLAIRQEPRCHVARVLDNPCPTPETLTSPRFST